MSNLFARTITVPRQRLDLAYAEWNLGQDSGPGWGYIAQFIADLESGGGFFRLTVYPYARGRYALRPNPRDRDYYETIHGRHMLVIRIKRDNPALPALLRHYDHRADGLVADNHDPALFDHPIQLEPGFAIAGDETVLLTGHDCDFIVLLAAAG